MGRGKVQLKRIENKSNRQVTFSKRKTGLHKKARELAVLCDVDVALLIFSPRGRLYQFPGEDSLRKIIERYQHHVDEEAAVCKSVNEVKMYDEILARAGGANLWEMVERACAGQNIEQLNVTELIQLERKLESLLRETRFRKTQLMMDKVAELNEKDKQLRQDNHGIEEKIAARQNENNRGRSADPFQQGMLRLF